MEGKGEDPQWFRVPHLAGSAWGGAEHLCEGSIGRYFAGRDELADLNG